MRCQELTPSRTNAAPHRHSQCATDGRRRFCLAERTRSIDHPPIPNTGMVRPFDTFRAGADLGYSASLACDGCHVWGTTDECQFDVNEGFRRGKPMH